MKYKEESVACWYVEKDCGKEKMLQLVNFESNKMLVFASKDCLRDFLKRQQVDLPIQEGLLRMISGKGADNVNHVLLDKASLQRPCEVVPLKISAGILDNYPFDFRKKHPQGK